MSKIYKVLGNICCILLVLATILSVVDLCCFDKNFYKDEYTKLNTANYIKVSNESLTKITDKLLDYLKDKEDNLDLKLEVDDNVKEVFNDREKLHMIDVKNLYLNAMTIRNISLIISIIILLLIFITKNTLILKKAYINSLIIFGSIFLFICLFCLIDFNTFWTEFHHIFFPMNDYWLLDPRTCILINIVPEQFFFDLCIKIVIIILIVLSLYYFMFSFRKKANND